MKRVLWLAFAVAMTIFASGSFGDTVTFTSGGEIRCDVVRDGNSEVLVLLEHSLVSLPKSTVKAVVIDPPLDTKEAKPGAGAAARRIPSVFECLKAGAGQAWGEKIRQIPAFVIDKGVMRRVPYKSFRVDDWEINCYGDPDRPAGFEIGIYGRTERDAAAKIKCREYIASLLSDAADIAAVQSLKDGGGESSVGGWTFETTPATAEDAYGAWWISIYDPAMLDKVRASDQELQEISESAKTSATPSEPQKKAAEPSEAKPSDDPPPSKPDSTSSPTKPPSSTSKPASKPTPLSPAPRASPSPVTVPTEWARNEYQNARKAPSSGGGRVYVRGYFRKDGTYVRSHSRRR